MNEYEIKQRAREMLDDPFYRQRVAEEVLEDSRHQRFLDGEDISQLKYLTLPEIWKEIADVASS
ncbi:MAG: hypothetical protein Q7S56_01085 [Nanoarchaeota archaeon]|nr:hypothetical protein [Nanoarchaeota archaeon]